MSCSGNCNCACPGKNENLSNGGEFTVIFSKEGTVNDVKDKFTGEETLLDIAMDNGIPMDHACGGNGACTTCMVKVKEGAENLTELTDREMMMGMNSDHPEYRLGCQCSPTGDVSVEVMY